MSGTAIPARRPRIHAQVATIGTDTPALASTSTATVRLVSSGTASLASTLADRRAAATTAGCGVVLHALNASRPVEAITASAVTLGTEILARLKAVKVDLEEGSVEEQVE